MYARHIPVAVFSLALVIDGIPNIGVVYNSFTDSLYSAIKGKGELISNGIVHNEVAEVIKNYIIEK